MKIIHFVGFNLHFNYYFGDLKVVEYIYTFILCAGGLQNRNEKKNEKDNDNNENK